MSDLISRVEELAALLDEHKLAAIKVKDGDLAIELRRETGAPAAASTAPAQAQQTSSATPLPSPMVGVFYTRPSPGEDAYVQVGDRISVGQVVGIIEAMKVFNEIESPIGGVIAACVAEDGSVVQEGDALYLVES
ncbi:MAG TPA: biotin/lipoyl-containing protein [Fimbriimonadales bacterium]|jgi:acetyl-CoA carboxylase biotin carboxyl carrier protein|nr:biotin/lipoyl-containing protein [Fimbriimonadales bacterium]